MNYASFDLKKHPDLHPIFVACKNENIAEVEDYLASGVSPYIDHPDHPSLGVIAIGNGNIKLIDALVAHGLDVNLSINRFGETLLLRAIAKNDAAMVTGLLNHGANPNLADQIGFTPLMAASACGDINIIEFLIKQGSDPNQISHSGKNSLMWAVASDQVTAIKWWVAHGSDLEQRDSHSNTPLISAAKGGRVAATQELLGLGADVHAKDKRGKTAFDWAKENGHAEIVELLQSRLPS